MSYRGTVVVVPTRNRADLASMAVRSVIDQAPDDVTVMVSDNSTSAADADRLARFCAGLDDEVVRCVRPPEPLPMPAHWQWALESALALTDASHVVYLTDRMIFKRGELDPILRLVIEHPDVVLTYNHDTVLDHELPVRLALEPWTGRLFEVSSDHLLYLSSRGVVHASLPRMLNSCVPRNVLDEVERRFGTVFASISPDFCFAYRCLATIESILYYDKAPLLQHALTRSHGSSYMRGIDSQDRSDFTEQLGATAMNFAAPVPEFQTIRNAIFHEYAFVKGESGSEKFPEIDPRGYLAAIVEDLSQVENRDVRGRMLAILADNGWVGAPKRRYDAGMRAIRFMFLGWDVARGAFRALSRLAKVGARFDAISDAIEHAQRHPRPRQTDLAHVEALLRPGVFSEVVVPATTARRREAPRPD